MKVLISKKVTSNLGNEALTIGFFGLYSDADDVVRLGRPPGLARYTLAALDASASPLRQFSSWVDEISLATRWMPRRAVDRSAKVTVVAPVSSSAATTSLRGSLKKAVRPYVWCTPETADYLAVLKSAEAIVYSGAGEVGDYDAFLRQALMLEAAMRVGVPVSIVNHSMVVTSPALLEIVRHIYTRVDAIVVRGAISKQRLIELGVADARITVAPDTAWRMPPKTHAAARAPGAKPRVGVVVNALADPGGARFAALLEQLASTYELVFFTTDAFHDHALAVQLADAHRATCAGPLLSAADAMAVLAGLDAVVSSRLHACVLALLSGTPAVAVERGGHKTVESFALAGVDVPVIAPDAEDLTSQILNAVARAVHSRLEGAAALAARTGVLAEAAAANRI
jgi:polysaccharide pyruvyl transferase WcaK-like protein